MQKEPVITFRNVDSSPAVEAHIRQRFDELEKYHSRIVGCRVVLHADKKKISGRDFEVQLTISVPGPDIYIARKVGRSEAADDVNLAIHKVFDAARRKLKEQGEKMSGHQTKIYPVVLHGTIDRLFPGEGYGFIKANDGKEVYFERDNLTTGNWNDVAVDQKVRFREEIGEKGPYAINVAVTD